MGDRPCPHIDTFKAFLEKRHGVKVVVGTHPIPKKYLDMHNRLGTWGSNTWQLRIAPTMCDAVTRANYDYPALRLQVSYALPRCATAMFRIRADSA